MKKKLFVAVNFNSGEVTNNHATEEQAAKEAVECAQWTDFSVAVIISHYAEKKQEASLSNFKRTPA